MCLRYIRLNTEGGGGPCIYTIVRMDQSRFQIWHLLEGLMLAQVDFDTVLSMNHGDVQLFYLLLDPGGIIHVADSYCSTYVQ